MRSTMNHLFSVAPGDTIHRSTFDRSHTLKTTFNSGKLVPILVDEILPGDTLKCNINALVRMTTPITPVMDNIFLETFSFFVPNRLLWSNFKKMMGEQANPGDSVAYQVPISTSPAGGYLESTLQDYMGLPTKIAGYNHTVLHTRAYNLIWNEWFRDENLQNSVTVDTGDGPDTVTNYTLLSRGKRHDYFTSLLPWPQKATAVSLPLGTSATVKRVASAAGPWVAYRASTQTLEGAQNLTINANSYLSGGTSGNNQTFDPQGSLYADLSTATAATINDLIYAFATQDLYAKDARGGTRYTEIVRSHFGVTSSDARLQRPELLGVTSQRVNINPIAQTSVTAATPQGNLAGVATVSMSKHAFVRSFEEHGVILILANVRADLTYQQGLDRMWSRRSKLDFFWPSLANLGEEAIPSKEIYCDGTGGDDTVMGYQERWAAYRYKMSRITGLMRSNATGTLHTWHLSQQFGARPTLNSTFITDAPPISRVIAVPSQPEFFGDFGFEYIHARPMPVYSIPSLNRL